MKKIALSKKTVWFLNGKCYIIGHKKSHKYKIPLLTKKKTDKEINTFQINKFNHDAKDGVQQNDNHNKKLTIDTGSSERISCLAIKEPILLVRMKNCNRKRNRTLGKKLGLSNDKY